MARKSMESPRIRSSRHPRRLLSEFLAEIGKKGGHARASALTAERRAEIASKASQAAARARSEKVRARQAGESKTAVGESVSLSSTAVRPAIDPVTAIRLRQAFLNRKSALTRSPQFPIYKRRGPFPHSPS